MMMIRRAWNTGRLIIKLGIQNIHSTLSSKARKLAVGLILILGCHKLEKDTLQPPRQPRLVGAQPAAPSLYLLMEFQGEWRLQSSVVISVNFSDPGSVYRGKDTLEVRGGLPKPTPQAYTTQYQTSLLGMMRETIHLLHLAVVVVGQISSRWVSSYD